MTHHLILASASPRRSQLLKEAMPGLDLIIEPADIDETRLSGEDAETFVQRMASEKAAHVAAKHPNAEIPVLAADTIVVHHGEILGKPINTADAHRMLKSLSGDRHEVMTAVALIKGAHHESILCKTLVKFAQISPERIQSYISSGEPMDKAGAYGIQGGAASFVEWIEGSYTNVVGLPVAQTLEMLEHLSI